jgi:peptidase E
MELIAEKMASSNLIYLTGGLASVLVERLKNMCVSRLLSDYCGVIVGRSAGALALCRKCIITCRRNSDVKIINGLGLTTFTLKVHYKPEKDAELERLSKEEKIYAVPEGSALVYDNGNLSFINNVYLFHKGEKQILSEA